MVGIALSVASTVVVLRALQEARLIETDGSAHHRHPLKAGVGLEEAVRTAAVGDVPLPAPLPVGTKTTPRAAVCWGRWRPPEIPCLALLW